jgi:hypothetical protein
MSSGDSGGFVTDRSDSFRLEEYRALRATIRQRGSIRLIIASLTFSAWAAAILIVTALSTIPLVGLVPLIVLAAGFEIVFALHVGVERIGRYLQLHYEQTSEGPFWEHTAMRFSARGGGIHPLLPTLFLAAGLVNLALGTLLQLDVLDAASVQSPAEWIPFVALHVVFYIRVLQAIRFSSGQRAADLHEFERLRKDGGPNA